VHKAKAANLVQSPVGDDALHLWHCPLGHLNVKISQILQNTVSGMNLGKKKQLFHILVILGNLLENLLVPNVLFPTESISPWNKYIQRI
jgi:hypothetical protein